MGREGWHAAPYLPDRFFDFEEPLDDFLGFFIRWYFRASSLSGAAAFPGAGGCVLEGTIGEAQVSSQMRELWRRSWRKPSSCPGEDTCLPAAPGRKSPSGELLQREAHLPGHQRPGRGREESSPALSRVEPLTPLCLQSLNPQTASGRIKKNAFPNLYPHFSFGTHAD